MKNDKGKIVGEYALELETDNPKVFFFFFFFFFFVRLNTLLVPLYV